MSITVQFSHQMLNQYQHSLKSEMKFKDFSHLREFISSYIFAPIYRMCSQQNDFGRIIKREFFAVKNDGQKIYLGNIVLDGDKQ